jgi:hypothetical protein
VRFFLPIRAPVSRPAGHITGGPLLGGQVTCGVLTQPEIRERIENGIDVLAGGPERCRRFVTSEVERWGRVIRENNVFSR